MATTKEVEETLAIIRSAWNQQPQLRLCQLLSNVARIHGWKSDDLFYLPDEELRSGLKDHIRTINNKN